MEKKGQEKKGTVEVKKDSFGFRKGSKSSEAVKLLASGFPVKEARKKFETRCQA